MNDYQSSYFNRLVKLQSFPLMYTFENAEIMFTIKALKSTSDSFDISIILLWIYQILQNGKLRHIRTPENKSKHFYFNRLPCLWNPLRPFDLSLSVVHNKAVIKNFMWSHYMSNFNPDIPYT